MFVYLDSIISQIYNIKKNSHQKSDARRTAYK